MCTDVEACAVFSKEFVETAAAETITARESKDEAEAAFVALKEGYREALEEAELTQTTRDEEHTTSSGSRLGGQKRKASLMN